MLTFSLPATNGPGLTVTSTSGDRIARAEVHLVDARGHTRFLGATILAALADGISDMFAGGRSGIVLSEAHYSMRACPDPDTTGQLRVEVLDPAGNLVGDELLLDSPAVAVWRSRLIPFGHSLIALRPADIAITGSWAGAVMNARLFIGAVPVFILLALLVVVLSPGTSSWSLLVAVCAFAGLVPLGLVLGRCTVMPFVRIRAGRGGPIVGQVSEPRHIDRVARLEETRLHGIRVSSARADSNWLQFRFAKPTGCLTLYRWQLAPSAGEMIRLLVDWADHEGLLEVSPGTDPD